MGSNDTPADTKYPSGRFRLVAPEVTGPSGAEDLVTRCFFAGGSIGLAGVRLRFSAFGSFLGAAGSALATFSGGLALGVGFSGGAMLENFLVGFFTRVEIRLGDGGPTFSISLSRTRF